MPLLYQLLLNRDVPILIKINTPSHYTIPITPKSGIVRWKVMDKYNFPKKQYTRLWKLDAFKGILQRSRSHFKTNMPIFFFNVIRQCNMAPQVWLWLLQTFYSKCTRNMFKINGSQAFMFILFNHMEWNVNNVLVFRINVTTFRAVYALSLRFYFFV